MDSQVGQPRVIIVKGALLIIFGVAMYMGVSCSPVKFSASASNCSVSTPCVTGQGLLEVDQTFTFNANNQVDILVVDDNSGSMTTEQNNMGNALNGFIGNLMNAYNTVGLNWQVAVTTTDICGIADPILPPGFCPAPNISGFTSIPGAQGQFIGPLNSNPSYGNQYIITPQMSAPDQVFADTVQRGNQLGSGDERAIYAANLAINQANGANAGFFRDNANLAIVILSDEDERSVDGNCTDTDPADPVQYFGFNSGQCDAGYATPESNDTPSSLITNVQQTWGGAKNLMVNSIIIEPDDMTQYPDPNLGGQMQTCLQLQSHQPPVYTAHPGQAYAQLSQMTGGQVGSICDDGNGAFANMLTNITGAIVQQSTSNVITLANTPSSTPTVTFTPQANAVNWTWSGNEITLSARPASGTTVNVDYSYAQSN